MLEANTLSATTPAQAGISTPAYAATSASEPLAPFTIQRRAPGPHEILIDIASLKA